MAIDDPDMPVSGLTPSKEEMADLLHIRFRHDRKPFEHNFLLPDGWYSHPRPEGEVDVRANESEFLSLGLYSVTKDFVPPVLFSVGVRPAPAEGFVAEWLEKQCYLQQLALVRLTAHEFLFGWGADAIAMQASDIGPLKLRIVMFEDGKRLWALTAMAPVSLWEGSVIPLSRAICTFELDHPEGPTTPVLRKPEDDGLI